MCINSFLNFSCKMFRLFYNESINDKQDIADVIGKKN